MQDIKLKFSGLSYLTYCNNLVNFYRILRWVMFRMGHDPPMRHLSWKKHWPYVSYHYHQRQQASYIYTLWYWLTRYVHPCMGVKPLFFRIPNIFTVNILLKTRKIHSLIVFYKLFLSHIKVKISINSRHLLIVFFGCALPLIDTSSFQ